MPNVALVWPGARQDWPSRLACWSPTRPVSGGAPGSAVQAPDSAGRVHDARQRRGRDLQRVEDVLVPPVAIGGRHAGRGGVGDVDDVLGARRKRPGHPRVDRPEREVAVVAPGAVEQMRELGCGRIGREAQSAVLQRQADADRAEILPADAGSDRRARDPIPDDRRGALVGDADGLHHFAVHRFVGHFESGCGEGLGVDLDEAGGRGGAGQWAVRQPAQLRVWIDEGGAHAARADVDHQDAHGQRTTPSADGRPRPPGFRMPVGSSARLTATRLVKAGAPRLCLR